MSEAILETKTEATADVEISSTTGKPKRQYKKRKQPASNAKKQAKKKVSKKTAKKSQPAKRKLRKSPGPKVTESAVPVSESAFEFPETPLHFSMDDLAGTWKGRALRWTLEFLQEMVFAHFRRNVAANRPIVVAFASNQYSEKVAA